ncbi:unnamed protein product [Gordionus sp. m RMFG-2023]
MCDPIKSFLLLVLVLVAIKGAPPADHRYGTRIRRSSMCPPDVIVVKCFVSPCHQRKCPRYPLANCVPNYCGGCKHDFYYDGEKVTC